MRKNIIIGNWKMNTDFKSGISFVSNIEQKIKNINIEAGIAPQSPLLKDLKNKSKNLIIAAQNCHFESKGAFTGEISINILKEIGITHVILGHSERRAMYNETDESVNLKNIALLKQNLVPILCVGETFDEYKKKQTFKIIKNQIHKAYKNINKLDAKRSVIAYEPIWAIGTGKTATPEIAQNVCKFIRDELANIFDQPTAELIRIQYGGSVNSDNIISLLKQNDIDGALVGGASLNVDSFWKLLQNSTR